MLNHSVHLNNKLLCKARKVLLSLLEYVYWGQAIRKYLFSQCLTIATSKLQFISKFISKHRLDVIFQTVFCSSSTEGRVSRLLIFVFSIPSSSNLRNSLFHVFLYVCIIIYIYYVHTHTAYWFKRCAWSVPFDTSSRDITMSSKTPRHSSKNLPNITQMLAIQNSKMF